MIAWLNKFYSCYMGMATVVHIVNGRAGIFLENKFRGGKSSLSKIEGDRT